MGSTTLNYVYDANGNVTSDGAHSYTYDAENRVVSVDAGTTAQYAYDQQNRRIKKVIGAMTTHYVWEGNAVIAEHNGATGAVITNYTYAGSRMLNKISSGTTSYFLNDRLSARLTLDSSGNVIGRQAHLPFGEDLNSSGTTDKHKLTSYERDAETGNDYAVNRSYAQTTGRFNQADPYRASDYLVDPRSWNRYSYTRSDPVNRIDPLGLEDILTGYTVNVSAGSSYIDPLAGDIGNVLERQRLKLKRTDGEVHKGDRGEVGDDSKALLTRFKSLLAKVMAMGDCANKLAAFRAALEAKAKSSSLTIRSYDSSMADEKINDGRTLSEFFADNPNGASTLWTFNFNRKTGRKFNFKETITLGPQFFSMDMDQDAQARVLVHEVLHATLHLNDNDLATRLGVTVPSGGDASAAISDWFKNGCRNPDEK
ncbi:MAG: RHS repeat-associated core domain-containing protein [Acidobacteria bacterium]|nr:RHS repeat-associated core domain-containing protein [Acidobacteriota bacterium]